MMPANAPASSASSLFSQFPPWASTTSATAATSPARSAPTTVSTSVVMCHSVAIRSAPRSGRSRAAGSAFGQLPQFLKLRHPLLGCTSELVAADLGLGILPFELFRDRREVLLELGTAGREAPDLRGVQERPHLLGFGAAALFGTIGLRRERLRAAQWRARRGRRSPSRPDPRRGPRPRTRPGSG